MDRKTILAVALCLLFLIFYKPLLDRLGLGHYLAPGNRTTAVDTTRTAVAPPRAPGATAPGSASPIAGAPGLAAARTAGSAPPIHATAPTLERRYQIETPDYIATFTNRGARLISTTLKRYASAHGVTGGHGKPLKVKRGEEVTPGDRVVLAGGPLLAMDLGSGDQVRPLEELVYAVRESLDAQGRTRKLTFTATDSSGVSVVQTWRAREGNYALDVSVEIHGIPDAWRLTNYSFRVRSWPILTEADMLADTRALRATSLVGTNIHREHAGNLLKGPKVFEGNAVWAAVQSRYFVGGVIVEEGSARSVVSSAERRTLAPEELKSLPEGTKPEQEVAINSLVMAMPSAEKSVHRFVVYTGPAEYFALASLGHQLERAVDMGWSWVLPFSKLLLQLLNWLFAIFKNYGVAIIALATLVRIVLHPLNMMSMRSMRAMQRLQPEMDRIKEKYKNDPTAMNTAVMALYKEHKVNPAGGCLPLVLQMPLFLALYQVLLYAIELRQAPFALWVTDLSAPDHLFTVAAFPIRLLPVLMAGSGFLSQLVTPTPPQQRPTMYIMNAVMLVFFYNLPSGLVLYWTVMNLLTALQQWLVLRQDRGAPVSQAVEVKERPQGAAVARRRASKR